MSQVRIPHRHGMVKPSSYDGFTMIELITVIVLVGILGAIAGARYFDSAVFSSRSYADQTKALIRYAQKLAIAQNREVFVRSGPAGFALCYANGCAPGTQVIDPAGSNNGSSATQNYCIVSGVASTNWACIGAPSDTVVSTTPARNEFGAANYFFFDALGRPHNNGDAVGATSTFTTRMTLTFTSGSNVFPLSIEAETGYVH